MSESPQDVFAKNLQQSFGYPLRFPEPKPGLPSSYKEHGLHIGDVGYVDDVGMFEVLFNICFSSDHELHFKRDELTSLVGLTKFTPTEAPPIPNAFPPGRVICHGIQGSHGDSLKDTQSAPCKFISSSVSGAVLILSSGAVRHSLNKNKEEEFRKLAEKHAFDWCKIADSKSIYLITGFYKTSSWYLASFHDTRPIGQVLIERDDAGRYSWHSSCDYRQSPRENRNENQTVLVSGFKIEVRGWDRHIVVEKLASQPGNLWSKLTSTLDFLLSILIFLWQRVASRFASKIWDHGARIERVPALSQPFHPSDVINRFKLDKNAHAQVAVTHDSQWLSMLEENELPYKDITEEERFREFLEEKYICDSDSDNVVYLRRKTDIESNETHSQASDDLATPTQSLRALSFPPASDSGRRHVITRVRVENLVATLGRIPVAFYALVQFAGTKKRTKTGSISLHDNILEWAEEIPLPTDPLVVIRISVNASFEFEPMLGNGETLCVSEISAGDLAQSGSTYLHSSKDGENVSSSPSLLVTLEERRFDHLTGWSLDDTNVMCEDSSYVRIAKLTDEAHEILLKYHKDHKIGDLSRSIEMFELALSACSSNHDCRASALVNLATARFIHSRVHGVSSDLDTAITSYRTALALRPAPSQDRPLTLLHLAQALLYCYPIQGYKESIRDEIRDLAIEVHVICCEDSYERRSADLVLQTLKRYTVLAFGTLSDVNSLALELSRSERVPLDFERAPRLVNLCAALLRRFQLIGALDDLQQSISLLEEAMHLPVTTDGHVDKPWMLAILGEVLQSRSLRCGDLVDLDKSISMLEEAVRLTPDGHFDKPWMLTSLGDAFRTRFAYHAAAPDRDVCHRRTSHPSDLLRDLSPHSIPSSCNLNDLTQAISRYQEAVELSPDDHPDKPNRLNAIATCLLTRFKHLGNLDDLEQALLRNKDAVDLARLDGNPGRPAILKSVVSALLRG